jgi:thioredoxin reductase (NADPH)
VGDELFQAGDPEHDLVLIERGVVVLVRPATHDAAEEILVRDGAGRFLGELNLLTGQAIYLTARVVEAGLVHRVAPECLRRLMAKDAELSDILLRAFLARRERLQSSTVSRTLDIVGSGASAASLALRTYASRRRLPYRWFDTDSLPGRALMGALFLQPADLPTVVMPDRTLRRATPGDVARQLGLSYRRSKDKPVDLAIVGGGPAGLAAALYGASEGLATVLVDAVGPGGQAAASPRIENYLGFPSGLSGSDLIARASVQAMKFGAQIASPCRIVALDTAAPQLRVVIDDGTYIATRAVVVATGARYRSLPVDRWDQFVGAGIFYAATEIEARTCAGAPVTVVGGANSAGQAALFLAAHGCAVTVAVRSTDIGARMSSYLVERLLVRRPRFTGHLLVNAVIMPWRPDGACRGPGLGCGSRGVRAASARCSRRRSGGCAGAVARACRSARSRAPVP